LQRLGQFMAQGYLYGRPEPAEKTRERLAGLGMLNTADGLAPVPADDKLSDVA